MTGHLICRVSLHTPWLWPAIRGPVGRFFSELAQGWDERTGAGGIEHLAPLATAALDVGRRPERVLDVGCGTGAATLFLAREFPQARVRGVDLSRSMIDIATGKTGLDPEGRIAFRVADAAKLPYGDASFDLVCQVNMPVFANQLSRVVRPGGYLIIASSSGPDTPFHTPEPTLARVLGRRRIETVRIGSHGDGTFFVGRRESGAATI